jgi:uncharacterized protein
MVMSKLALVPLLVSALFVHTTGPIAAELPVTTLTINGQKLVAEVVATPELRANGLMNRFSLQPDHGMLFVFDRPQPLSFWMKNTYIPLSIAFIDADGKIINIEDMRPQDEASHWSQGLAQYAVEMKQGWFAARGIGPGAVVLGLPSLTLRGNRP